MSFIGVVCEYNPFHNGHAYHLRESRSQLGDQGVVCVMSGDFVQRGEAALFDKFARARAAVHCGADLVFELPLPWSLASAERFGRGAVGLLGALGADWLSFGAECDDLVILQSLARCLNKPETLTAIRAMMAQDATLSFAAARQRVLEQLRPGCAALLETPNNILAVEYCKAIDSLGLSMRPFALRREGSAHDAAGEGPLRSASEIRGLLRDGLDVSAFLPAAAAAVFEQDRQAGRGIVSQERIETALLSRLRALESGAFAAVPDGGGGLSERLIPAAAAEPTLQAVCDKVKNKRLAMSRVRRACLCAALGVESGMAEKPVPYARLLAANERGRALLSGMKKSPSVPILIKPAAIRQADEWSQRVFALGAKAHDLYVLGYPEAEQRRGDADWRTGPVIL